MEIASLIISILSLLVSIAGLVLAIRKQIAEWQRARERCTAHVKYKIDLTRCQMMQFIFNIIIAAAVLCNSITVIVLIKKNKGNNNA